jgi:hypothetical protein
MLRAERIHLSVLLSRYRWMAGRSASAVQGEEVLAVQAFWLQRANPARLFLRLRRRTSTVSSPSSLSG